ncbi:MAG: hypothetical protein NTW35_00870 [Candidatus Nomurabacteria bacterium]|nr:hypothetical protein [Candidatus Nomurabacteria bacterium]
MQDIRKPYSHSRSNRDIPKRVEEFERHEEVEEIDDRDAVLIPTKTFKNRRSLDSMEMYPRRANESMQEISSKRERVEIDREPDTDPYTPFTGVKRRKSDNSFGTWMFIITTIVIIVGAGLFTFVFNSAKITYIPKFKDVEVSKTFLFSRSATSTLPTISYIIATTTKSETKVLAPSETKKIESKASGIITVYNNFDSNPQKLIKNTRFESGGGKIYRINQSVTVPGKKGDTPGSIDVTLYADSYGAEYNIGTGTKDIKLRDFTIPGFKGSARYTGFYGRLVGVIKGGAGGNMSLVSQSDLNGAKDGLAVELEKSLKEELSKVTREGTVPMYNTISVSFSDNETEVMSGLTSTYEVTATGYLMLAKESELASMIATETMRDYSDQPVKLAYANELVFTTKKDAIPYSDNSLDVLVEGKPRVVLVADTEDLKLKFLGKNRSDAPSIIQTLPSIAQIEMSFFPIWLSTIPTNKEHVSLLESLPKR